MRASGVDQPPVLLEMPASERLVGRIEPLHVAEASLRSPEMGEVDCSRLVVVREVARLSTVGCGLDRREGRVGEPGDPRSRPLFRRGDAEHEGQRKDDEGGPARHDNSHLRTQYRGAGSERNAHRTIHLCLVLALRRSWRSTAGGKSEERSGTIRLTDERLAHIVEHPEMAGLEQAIEATLRGPEWVVGSLSDPQARLYYRFYFGTRVGDRYLCVVVKVAGDDAFVLTAYLTDRIKRGVALWPRES